MRRFVLLLLLVMLVISGCGGGGGGSAVIGDGNFSTRPDNGTGSSDDPGPAPTIPTTDVIRRVKTGDTATYALTDASGANAGALKTTTTVDTGTAAQYGGDVSYHISWEVKIPSNAATAIYTRDDYYEQKNTGGKAGTIYYIGYKTPTKDYTLTSSSYTPAAYLSPMRVWAAAGQTYYTAAYADGSSRTITTDIGSEVMIGKWPAFRVTTTLDHDFATASVTWFSAEMGYPVIFPVSFQAGAKIYNLTAALTAITLK